MMKNRPWRKVWLFALILVLLAIVVIVFLSLIGSNEGAIFSQITR